MLTRILLLIRIVEMDFATLFKLLTAQLSCASGRAWTRSAPTENLLLDHRGNGRELDANQAAKELLRMHHMSHGGFRLVLTGRAPS